MAIPLAALDSLDDLIRGRRSMRRYVPRPIPREDLLAVVDAARWAPSPHNTFPWRFALLTRAARKAALSDAMARRWRADLAADGLSENEREAQIARSCARLNEAPALLVASLYLADLDQYPDSRRQGAEHTMAAHSLGAALQTVMLAAHARGLATCWMCAPLFCPEVVVEALHLPDTLVPQAIITLGYPAAAPRQRERIDLDRLLVLDD